MSSHCDLHGVSRYPTVRCSFATGGCYAQVAGVQRSLAMAAAAAWYGRIVHNIKHPKVAFAFMRCHACTTLSQGQISSDRGVCVIPFIPYCHKGKSHQIVLFVRMIARFISVYRGVSWRMKRSMPSWTGVSSTAQRRTHDGALVRSRHHPSIRVSVRKAYLPSCFRPVRGRMLVVAFAAEHVHCREVQFGSTFPSIALAFMQPSSLVNAGRRRFALKSVRIRAALLSQAIPEWSGDCLTFAELEEPLDDTCTFILLLGTC
jgi:hypothetical protein